MDCWEFWARPEQLWDWDGPNIQMLRFGRGGGKTRAGSEHTHIMATRENQARCGGQILIAGPTVADVRSNLIEGPGGLIATQKADNPMEYEPSKLRVTWASGTVGHIRTSEKPRSFRGLNTGYVWCDELAFWSYVEDCWSNITLLNRVGSPSTALITTTPLPSAFIRELCAREDVLVKTGSTFDNPYLDKTAVESMRAQLEGTRLGRQELWGEILDDNPHAIFSYDSIRRINDWDCPDFVRTIIGVDPAGGTAASNPDETGIVVVSIDANGALYVRADRSTRDGYQAWGRAVVDACLQFNADHIAVESNFGGDQAEAVIRGVEAEMVGGSRRPSYREVGTPIELRRSIANKEARAGPVSARYEQGRGFHVGGPTQFRELESQMVEYDPDIRRTSAEKHRSPDRMDAMVHAALMLMERHDAGAQTMKPIRNSQGGLASLVRNARQPRRNGARGAW